MGRRRRGGRLQGAAGRGLTPAQSARAGPGRGRGEPCPADPPSGLRATGRHRQLDLQRFEELAEGARAALAAANPAAASEGLREALALWRGAPLADLGYERLRPDRDRPARGAARRRRSRSGSRPISRSAAMRSSSASSRRSSAAIRCASVLRAQLMLALYRSGRQAEALEAYQDARRALVEELGIEPGRELRRAPAGDPPARHVAAPTRGGRAPAPRSMGPVRQPSSPAGRFVGREARAGSAARRPRRRLRRARAALPAGGRAGNRQEPPRRGADRARERRGGGYWSAAAGRRAARPAYWPWVQSLRAYVRASGHRRAALAARSRRAPSSPRSFPSCAEHVPDVPEASSPESESARFRLFDATAQFLRNACDSRPIVLVLDDLHAADAPSLLLLRFLARELGSARILLLAAYRDVDPVPGSPLTATLAEVTREPVDSPPCARGAERARGRGVRRADGGADRGAGALAAALHAGDRGQPALRRRDRAPAARRRPASPSRLPSCASASPRASATSSPAGSPTSRSAATGCSCSRP